jgi:hypothetical protein
MSNLKHCDICGLNKSLEKMYSRKLHGIIKYSIGCNDCYNNKVRNKRELKRLYNLGILKVNEQIPNDHQYCHNCNTFKLFSNYRIIKIRKTIRHDTKCNICINKKDKIKYQNKLEYWKLNPSDQKVHYKLQRESMNRRIKRDPIFHMTVKCRDRFKKCLQSGKEWFSHLDCSIEFLKEWFEYQFRLLKVFDGIELSWDNRKEWHIDHVIPCNAFDFSNEIHRKTCFNWSNLAPLPKRENILKGDKIIQQSIKRQIILANIYKNLTGNKDKTVKITSVCDYTGALTTAVNGKLLMQQVE